MNCIFCASCDGFRSPHKTYCNLCHECGEKEASQPAIPEPTIETKLKSKHADLLNALNEMQQVMLCAARRSVLRYAENLITSQESQLTAARLEIERLRKACEKLDELDWMIGYEVVESNQVILDEALTLARQALSAKGGGV